MFNQKKADLEMERFPSGQRGQTVNLLAMPSEVRILPSPPVNSVPFDLSKLSSYRFSTVSGISISKLDKNGTIFELPNNKRRLFKCGSSSVGRASAFQAEGRGFEPRFPLHCFKNILLIHFFTYLANLSF